MGKRRAATAEITQASEGSLAATKRRRGQQSEKTRALDEKVVRVFAMHLPNITVEMAANILDKE
eukprot:9167772-Lingulodinium_polyedra.AAC.1